jgi:hypothetical protein
MGHEDRGSWDWEQTPQPPVPKELRYLNRLVDKRCVLCDSVMPAEYPHVTCEACVDAGKLL